MELSPIYKRDLAEATERGVQQGLQQGLQQERRMTVESFLTIKFGSLDPELVAIVQPIVDLAPSEYSSLLLEFSNLSRS